MPILETKTVRLRKDQTSELLSEKFKGRSSFLFRQLLDIYLNSKLPGQDIISLKRKMTLPSKEFAKLDDE